MAVRATHMTGSEKGPEVTEYMGMDVYFSRDEVAHFIPKLRDPIFSLPIDGRKMEKRVIGISISEPTDFGFSSPKIFLIFEHAIIVTKELILQVLKEPINIVVREFLDAILLI